MDMQELMNSVPALASLYSFDIMPDGSFSEIRFEAVNKKNAISYIKNYPHLGAPSKGSRMREYFTEPNFESYIYRCASRNEMLNSYVNAHGAWIKGVYLPVTDDGELIEAGIPVEPGSEPKTVRCLYFMTRTLHADTDSMAEQSADVSKAVMNLSIKLHETPDFHLAMAAASSVIQKVCDAKRCSIYIVDRTHKQCELYSRNGERKQFLNEFTHAMGRTPYETAQEWEKDLRGSDCILLDDIKGIELIDPIWYKSLSDYGLKNIILFAVRYEQEIIGYIWAADFDVKKMMFIKETLELSSFLLASVIANHQLVSNLAEISLTDSLTHVNNRNAMNKRVDKIISGTDKPAAIGVVMVDLNGLKTINDEKGHGAGDRLLTNAAAFLKVVFGEDEIYRIGGDEFLVIIPDALPDDIEKKIAQLRALADNTPDVSFAVGFECTDGDYNIRRVMQIADEKMYEDKEEYYLLHADKDRRKKYIVSNEKFGF